MAKQHKSEYKAPKDEAKSLKAETRKDMKDYTAEDAPNMVPGGVKGVQPNVPRKYATEVIDNIENMVPEIKNRLYKKIEEGEYSADHARKVFEKLQIEDTDGFLEKLERIDHGAITNSMVKPENEEKLQERVNRLSEENKERLIREYVRRKIAIMIREQVVGTTDPDTGATETPPADTATDTAAATPPPAATPTTVNTATDTAAATPPPAATDPAADEPTDPAADEPTDPAADEPTDLAADEPTDPDAKLQSEKGPWQQAQQLLISRLADDPRYEEKLTAIFLNLLDNTMNKISAETGEEVDKPNVQRNIIIWMNNNGFFGNSKNNLT